MERNIKFLAIFTVLLCLCVVVACVETDRAQPVMYKGPQPQTPVAILEAFDPNLIKRATNTNNERIEWLRMLLDKGFVIEDSHDFKASMSIRKSLNAIEDSHDSQGYKSIRQSIGERELQNEIWRLYNQEYDNWETFKDAFIKRKIWEHKQFKAAQQKNSNVWWVDFLGADGKTVIPITNSSRYVKVTITKHKDMGVGVGMTGGGVSKLSEQQKFDLIYKGKHPRGLGGWKWGWGWKILYLDEENNVLPKKPEPIRREDLGLPPDVSWPPKNREHLDRIIDETKRRDMKNQEKIDKNIDEAKRRDVIEDQ